MDTFIFMAEYHCLFSRQEYWNGLPFPFPMDHILSDLSTMTRPSWVAPQAWLGFNRQCCGPSVIRLTSFLWVWFQCVCPLMPSCNTYRLTWVSLTLGVGYVFTAAPAKCSRCSLPWTRGYLLTAAVPDLQRGIAPLGPPVPAQPPLITRWSTPKSDWLYSL